VSPNSPPRILVTRSEPAAWETAARLEALGFDPIAEPVFAVEPIVVTIPFFDALAFTSANGVREFSKLSTRRDAPVFCVGGRTAEAARSAGFTNVSSAEGDVQALSALIQTSLPAGAHLLHPGNEETRGDLAGQRRSQGGKAEFVAIYRAVAAVQPGPALAAHLTGQKAFDAVLIHSPRGAAILAGFVKSAPSAPTMNVAAISPAAAAPLEGLARIRVAATPDEAALISALSEFSFFD
jgi:uroporphyrinogen-III synthase